MSKLSKLSLKELIHELKEDTLSLSGDLVPSEGVAERNIRIRECILLLENKFEEYEFVLSAVVSDKRSAESYEERV